MMDNPAMRGRPHRGAPFDSGRRGLLLALVAATVSGCAVNRTMQLNAEALRLAIKGAPDVPLTRAGVNQIPYATIGAKIGKGPRSLLVLGRVAGDDLHWISADRAALVTRHGRLVASAGLPHNLTATRTVEPDPVATGLHRLQGTRSATRLVDITPGNLFSMPVYAELQVLGRERIQVLELDFDTLVVTEWCRVPLLEWEFENRFWVDARTGFVWRSVQHLSPEVPEVRIEVFKPAAV